MSSQSDMKGVMARALSASSEIKHGFSLCLLVYIDVFKNILRGQGRRKGDRENVKEQEPSRV